MWVNHLQDIAYEDAIEWLEEYLARAARNQHALDVGERYRVAFADFALYQMAMGQAKRIICTHASDPAPSWRAATQKEPCPSPPIVR